MAPTPLNPCLCVVLLASGAAAHGPADGGRSIGWVRQPLEAVVGKDVDYVVGGQTYEGYLAIPMTKLKDTGMKGVLIAHQYMGLGEYEKARADEMAGMGYAAFALDVYGKGVRCNDTACATEKMSQALADIPKLRSLISAGTQQLLEKASPTQLVAMGYCFGGGMVLELARHPNSGASAGVTYLAVSSIHGVLAPFGSQPAAQGEIKSWVQVHHGDLDFQGGRALVTLQGEIRTGVNGTGAEWEAITYGGAPHGWTEPGTPVYQARAAVQAHKSTFEFFETALGLVKPSSDPFPSLPFCQPQDPVICEGTLAS